MICKKRIAKKIVLVILSVSMVPCAAACSAAQTDTAYSARQIADVVIASQDEIAALHPLPIGEDYFAEYLSDIYRIGGAEVTDGIIYYTAGMFADEITVLKLALDTDIPTVQDALEEYIEGRTSAFTGYAPEQAAILRGGKVVTQGRHIALIICRDVREAESAFRACFSDTPPALPRTSELTQPAEPAATPEPETEMVSPPMPEPTPLPTPEPTATPDAAPETMPPDSVEDMYDPQAIVAAYLSGDMSILTPKNRTILEICVEVIYALITDDMSDYDKELAIHDWIIDRADYDVEANSNAPDAKPDPDNNNPYGLMVNGKAICEGYTYTFQLFMDLLGIECITVHGTAYDDREHAWNMVRIDGEWYCVDVTWNDPTGESRTSRSARHRYFNVPSQFMRDTDHHWDESSVPEATAPKLYR